MSRNSIGINKAPAAVPEISLPPITPTLSGSDDSEPRTDDRNLRHNIFGKVAGLLQRSRENSLSSTLLIVSEVLPVSPHIDSPRVSSPMRARQRLPVRETKHVSLEYDPITRRKVLNTYEIFREIGRGEHGKVKLARDLVNDELVAIKIVNRKSKKDRQLRIRRPSNMPLGNEYETKIKREIAIMKRCNHKYIVKLKEVLDDFNLYKIYLVLEYMEKGEIKWKRLKPLDHQRPLSNEDDNIPCCDSKQNVENDDNDLLSNDYSPNLTFKQSRRIFREVVLGLEYLHMQGIVHRDIKPANLLVSSENIVKISDFGVSFASSLGNSDDGEKIGDMELAKTVGTPAFFAPELCQTNFSTSTSTLNVNSSDMLKSPSQDSCLPKIDHKIDIWALGVTLYCLLFGKVPFNAESEFVLFDVIVNQPLEFPDDRHSFHSPHEVSQEEFDLAKDLLSKLLDKNSRTRIDISEIKQHPFVLLDLDTDIDGLHELFFLNSDDPTGTGLNDNVAKNFISQDEVDNAVVGIGARIRSSIVKAIKSKDKETLRKFALRMDYSISNVSSSDDSSNLGSHQNSYAFLSNPMAENSVILSEALQTSSAADSRVNLHDTTRAHGPSHLSQLSSQSQLNSGSKQSVVYGRSLMFLDVLESASASSSRKGSSGALQEAPQIETKRNVGGDLYLQNQSALEAFKGIQELDQKRRKSSNLVSNQSSSGTTSLHQTTSLVEEAPNQLPLNSGAVPSSSSSKIKVGPISIENRRPSSVISLPLTESFASLDSFNDDYLSYKYHEFRKSKNSKAVDPNVTNSDSVLVTSQNDPTVMKNINEKFNNFNLGSLMAMKTNGITKSEGIAPTANVVGTGKLSARPSSNSCSSGSSHSSYSSDSDSDEEAGNLTLKFSSKVTPKSRPHFLTFSNRAMSHESNLPNLIHQQNANNYYDVPIVFQDDLLQFEDVPDGLINLTKTFPDEGSASAADMTPSVSLMTNTSSSTIAQDVERLSMQPVQSSPLRQEVVPGSPRERGTGAVGPVDIPKGPNTPDLQNRPPIANGYFKNHYKKEPINFPFPKAKHLDGDKESFGKQSMKGSASERPPHYRSNSITVGILQHQRSSSDMDQ